MQERQKGLLITAVGVLLLSPDALVLRWVSADALHILAWRGLMMAAGLGTLLVFRYRLALPRKLLRCGWAGVGCALCYAVSTMSYITAMNLAGAASTLLIYSVSPLIAGLLAWAWLDERLSRRDLVVILGCVAGIALIVSDDAPGASLPGNLLALVAAALFAANLTLARSRPLVDMSPALLPGALLASILVARTVCQERPSSSEKVSQKVFQLVRKSIQRRPSRSCSRVDSVTPAWWPTPPWSITLLRCQVLPSSAEV